MGYLTIPQNYDPTDNEHDNDHDNYHDNDHSILNNKPSFSSRRKGNKCYYSNVVGSYIVDAITGEKFPWKVGSYDERRFFRYINTINKEDPYSRTFQKAFYENPHAFMRHTRVELDETLVNEWYDNNEKLYPGEYNVLEDN